MSTANRIQEKYELGFIRIFDAPVERVWRAWSEPEFFKRWWGPEGYTSHDNIIEFRVGGKFLWNTRSPQGKDIYYTGIYREIVPEKRIVASKSFADAQGNIVPASYYCLFGDWPTVAILTAVFDIVDHKTRMTLRESGVPEEVKEDIVENWNGSLVKLAKSLQ
jgi:uncharacterized protein YndB with AHSA1/START domain